MCNKRFIQLVWFVPQKYIFGLGKNLYIHIAHSFKISDQAIVEFGRSKIW